MMVQPMPDNSNACSTSPGAPGAAAGLEHAAADRLTAERHGDRNIVIPEVEETAEVTTRMIETGVVRITKHVHDVDRTFQPTLHDERIRIERIPVNRVIKDAPSVRTEGDTTVIPIVEEVMVKLLLLKEEVRVTRETVDKPSEPQHVTLRREEVIVERHPLHASAPPIQGAAQGGTSPSTASHGAVAGTPHGNPQQAGAPGFTGASCPPGAVQPPPIPRNPS